MESPRRIATESGDSLEYNGRLLYSRSEPRKRPDRVAAAVQVLPETLYLAPSPLLWYGVEALAKRIPASSHIIALETDPALISISAETRPAANEKITFLSLHGDENWIAILDTLPGRPFRRVVPVIFNGASALNRSVYESIRTEIETVIRIQQQDRMTRVYFARRWMKNLFENICASEEVLPYRRLTTTLPVVVAGAGESLESLLPEIKAKRRSIYLLAADTALPPLAAAGIIPDAAVVLESQFINMRDFYGVPTDRIDLIADFTACPGVRRLPWRRRFAFFTLFSELAFLRETITPALEEYLFPAYGSVGVAGVALARAISSAAVYCGGIDFCYQMGKSHARGTQFGVAEHANSTRIAPAGGWERFLARPLLHSHGKRGAVLTDLILMNYAEAFRRLAEGGGELFDLNPGGLDLGLPVRRRIDTDGGVTQSASEPSPVSAAAPTELVHSEIEYLDRLYREGVALLNGSGRWDAVYAELDRHDYLWAHFPEHCAQPPRDTTFLKRLLVAVEGYRYHLKGVVDRD